MGNILKIVAINVRKYRLSKKLTQEELAEKSELHINYIGLIERQKRNVSILALNKIAKSLNVDIKQLLDKNNE
jgi:transcriptional regulator with XRE-family HTH domain